MGSCAHHAGVSVCANPLQHTGGGPVVEGQLPGAVAAHPDPHSSQQHSYTRHGPLVLWRHAHVMVGLGLNTEREKRFFYYASKTKCDRPLMQCTNSNILAGSGKSNDLLMCKVRTQITFSPNYCLHQMSRNVLTSTRRLPQPQEIKNPSSLIYHIMVCLF